MDTRDTLLPREIRRRKMKKTKVIRQNNGNGDNIRLGLNGDLGFTKEDRKENIRIKKNQNIAA